MIRTQVYLPKTHLDVLRKEARAQRVPVSEVMRQLVDENLARPRRNGGSRDVMSGMFAALKEIEKRGEKGPSDLAQNMDTYLYGNA